MMAEWNIPISRKAFVTRLRELVAEGCFHAPDALGSNSGFFSSTENGLAFEYVHDSNVLTLTPIGIPKFLTIGDVETTVQHWFPTEQR